MSTRTDQADERADEMRIDRRTALKWVMAAGAALRMQGTALAAGTTAAPAGYGKDPDLLKVYEAGALWPLTFTREQRALASVLCDTIIPADDRSPAASELGVVDFIDEWISAPYKDQVADRRTVLQGFAWLDAEAKRRHAMPFAKLDAAQRKALCDDIGAKKVETRFAQAAKFFDRYRSLTAGGFYTTPVGMKDLRYVGNVATTTFEGPPASVLKQLELADSG
jgi:Gluconate 2-dehydrogenase subunit 3